jgi:nitronate monooxygenase
VQQEYFKAGEDDIEVNGISPTGYPMRMLKNSPAIGAGIRPNCEAYGYLLDSNGNCAYIDAYNREVALHPGAQEDLGAGQDLPVHPHAQLRLLDLRPLHLPAEGHHAQAGGRQLPTAECRAHLRDYQHSRDGKVALPE